MDTTGRQFPPEVLDLELLHACARRGIKLRLSLTRPLLDADIADLIQNVQIVRLGAGGFFRGNLGQWIVATGIPGKEYLTLQFSLFYRDRALQDLERCFPGLIQSYESGLRKWEGNEEESKRELHEQT